MFEWFSDQVPAGSVFAQDENIRVGMGATFYFGRYPSLHPIADHLFPDGRSGLIVPEPSLFFSTGERLIFSSSFSLLGFYG